MQDTLLQPMTITRPRNNKGAMTGYFTGLGFGLTLSCLFGILQGFSSLDIRWFSLGGASFFGLIMLLDRKQVHDATMMVTRTYSPEPQQIEPEKIVKTQVINQQENSIKYSKYQLTEKELKRLAKVFYTHDYKCVRNVVKKAQVFKNITESWNEIYKEFERLGWADNGRLTENGIYFFNQYLP